MALTYQYESTASDAVFTLPKFCPIARQTCRVDCIFRTVDGDCLLKKLAEKLLGDRR